MWQSTSTDTVPSATINSASVTHPTRTHILFPGACGNLRSVSIEFNASQGDTAISRSCLQREWHHFQCRSFIRFATVIHTCSNPKITDALILTSFSFNGTGFPTAIVGFNAKIACLSQPLRFGSTNAAVAIEMEALYLSRMTCLLTLLSAQSTSPGRLP